MRTQYALAAYNAGDERVKSWQANGPYADLPEFVESIPFTQTREYVQAILRNAEIYRKLYEPPSQANASAKSTAADEKKDAPQNSPQDANKVAAPDTKPADRPAADMAR